ncbi:proprotein convertase subtilisin/kexin type 5-like [Argopecten irradians]|uniref:proprotein convertase subtilisin/kexin type 5-like n=1 Tax=Argopecten irradians TaxID=31199 RepID=UPI00371E3D44
MFSDGITCVHTCDKRMYVFNASCVYNCPSDHKLLEGSAPPYTCMEQCRPHQKLYHNHCLEKCPDDMLLSNSSGLSKCPKENSTIYNGTCVSKCPINLVDNSGVCMEHCVDSEYVLNQACVASCPLKYVVKFRSWQPYIKFCVSSCDTNIGPDWYRYECRCLGSLLLYNNTCVTKCPSLYPIVYNGKCLVECPDGFVAYNGKCQSSCPKNSSYVINNNVCAKMCPSSHQYFATLHMWDTYKMTFVSSSCLDKCAEQNFAEISYNMDCIDTCPDKTVIFRVPRCIHNCSSDESIYRRTFNSHYHIYICVKECPDTSFKWKNHCYDQCPSYLPSYQPNRTCVKECPRNTFHVQNTCNKTCNGYIFNRTECVYFCPRNAPFVLGQNCVSKCPVSHVLNQQDGRCVETCLPNVKLNRTCYRTCPDSSPIVLNNTCVKECPKNFNLTAPSPQGFICVNECKPPLVRDGNRCTVTCGQKLVVNNVCENTTKCPDSFRFVENSTRGQICRKKCTEKQFNFNEVWCVNKCPNFAMGQRCLDHCPPSHPYTFHEKYAKEKDSMRCYSNCPTITFGAFCVDSCPESHRAVESTRTCEKTCPASDPIKTDSRCLQPCSITESFSKLEQKCIPMSPGLVAAILVTFVIAVLGIIGVFFMCKTPTIPRNKSNSPDAAAMADESAKPQRRENTNNSVKYECATSTIHFEGDLSQHGRGCDTEKDLTGATMDTTKTETGLDNSGFSDPETSNI